jgi:hypothetical protein
VYVPGAILSVVGRGLKIALGPTSDASWTRAGA